MNAFMFWAAVAAHSLRTGQHRTRASSPSAAHLLLVQRIRKTNAATTEAGQ